MADLTESIIAEFRANAGRVGGMFEGADLVLLTTTGARSGARRTTPLVCAREDGHLLVFASNAGGPRNPGWYHNLLAHPRAEVEDGDGAGGVRTFPVRAEPLAGEARAAAYARQAERVPAYADYARATDRTIPVVALRPLDLTAPDPARNEAIARQLLGVHTTLRAQLAELRAGRPAPGDLAVHCLAFCDALGSHHTTEDNVMLAFDAGFPQLAHVLARLREEHRAVAGELAELTVLAEGVADPAAEAELRHRLDDLAADMERHFAYEERHLIPALTGREPGE